MRNVRYINCNIWTATRKIELIQLKAPDFPRELASPGSIKTLNPEELGVFKQIRHKIDSMCKKYGSSFCGNWIIPNEKLDLVTAELDRFKGEFAEAKRILSADTLNCAAHGSSSILSMQILSGSCRLSRRVSKRDSILTTLPTR